MTREAVTAMEQCNDYYEARQHLNLSRRAYDVVQSDKYDLLPRPSLSGMLNLIFSSFREDADAAIDSALARERDRLTALLSPAIPAKAAEDAVAALLGAREEELVRAANGYEHGCQLKFQLSRENYEYIRRWRDEKGHYNGSAGRFIKAVIEEYAAKPYCRREAIIFAARIGMLRGCIAGHTFIHVTTRTGGVPVRYEVRPYAVCTDSAGSYNYLVGLSRPAGEAGEERPASFRISRIEKITPSAAKSGRITAAQKKTIDELIAGRGVQFLLCGTERVRVRLTQEGRQMYERLLHLRPRCIEGTQAEDGTWVCEFQCTDRQAMFYFFKFGAEAEILSPEALRDEFYRGHKRAAAVYEREAGAEE